nr:hypothetical protein [Afipia massiliensis]
MLKNYKLSVEKEQLSQLCGTLIFGSALLGAAFCQQPAVVEVSVPKGRTERLSV